MTSMHAFRQATLALATLPLLWGCSGGGSGGGSTAPIRVGFAAPGSNVGENGGSVNIAVQLSLMGDPIEDPVSVTVMDSGLGLATAGTDTTPFTSSVVTFPAGSANGATQLVAIQGAPDALVEGDEDLSLVLATPTGGAKLITSASLHTLIVDDADEATLAFTTPSTTTVDEQPATYPVVVQFGMSGGLSLERDVRFVLSDTGTGTATANSDYDALGAPTLTFPVGTANGATQQIAVQVRDDGTSEINETLHIALSNIEGGARIQGTATHDLTITDDDLSPTPFLAATVGGTNVMNGDPLDLGAQFVGAGANPGHTLALANAGQNSMALGAPTLSGPDTEDFQIEVSAGSSPVAPLGGPRVSLQTPLVPIAELNSGGGTLLAIDDQQLASLQGMANVDLEEFVLPGEDPVTLELRRIRSPWAPNGILLVDGQPLPGGHHALLGDTTFWRGTVQGREDSAVFLSFSPHGSRGWVRLSHEEDEFFHLLADSDDPTGRVARLMRDDPQASAAQLSAASMCGGALHPDGFVGGPGQPSIGKSSVGSISATNCRLAIETDYQFWQEFGNTSAATTYATQLIAAVSDQYFQDIQVTFSIEYLAIYSNASDPWTSPDGGSSTVDLLNEFRAAWIGGWPVSADLAHFLSGANLGGGVAYVNVLCSQSFGFGVSANINGNINWGSFQGAPSSLNWDFVVVSHELGHNFNARHTHDYCPPLDSCQSTCEGGQSCGQGTIMSYCHLCSGGLNNIDTHFHPFVANQMRSAVNSSCLGQSTMPGGSQVEYDLRFRPVSGTGPKQATLRFPHDASNTGSPFTVELSATAQ